MADVARFLRGKGFDDNIIKGFMDNDIDMTCLPTITESDLKELGIGKTFGERRRLAIAIQTLKSPNQSASDNIHVQLKQAPCPCPTQNYAGMCYRAPLTKPEHYNIRRILESHPKGKGVLRDLDSGKIPSVKNRRALVQVTVAYLIENGGHLLYPKKEQKLALALAIVSQFPCMKDQVPGTQGHEYLYHKGGGFLEFRLKTLRSTAARQKATCNVTEEILEMHSLKFSNQSANDNILVQMDQAAHPSLTETNVESQKMLGVHCKKSPNQSANDINCEQQDLASHPSSSKTNVEPEELLGMHSLKCPNQSANDNICAQMDRASCTSIAETNVESDQIMSKRFLKYPNQSASDVHEQQNQAPCPSLSQNSVEQEKMLGIHSSPIQSANDNICLQQDHAAHPSKTKNSAGPEEMLGITAGESPSLSANDNSRVQLDQALYPIGIIAANCYSGPPLSRPQHYNIRRILESHPKGRGVLKDLDSGKMPSVKNRRALVQVTVAYLIENGGHLLYPTGEQKQALALAIVSQFPCMKDQLPGAEGHEYLYHKGGGFLEFRLKTLRSSVARQKARKKPSESEEMVMINSAKSESDNIHGRMDQVSYPYPTEGDAASYDWAADDSEETMAFKAFLKDTHSQRHKWILEGDLSITDIISVYPCFKDMPALIDYDFLLKYGPEIADSLTAGRQAFAEPILALAKTHENSSEIFDTFGDDGDKDLCALQILLELLPSSNGHRCRKQNKGGTRKKASTSKAEAAKHVFQHMPIGTDVAAYAVDKPAELTQPLLLCLGPKTAPEEYYLIVDHLALPAGNSALDAFDRLFKTHYVFNAHFDHHVFSFYNFFASIVYKVAKNAISPQVRAFYLLLCNQGNE